MKCEGESGYPSTCCWRVYANLGLGHTSNFSGDEPNLVSYVYGKFDAWLSLVGINEFGSFYPFCPSATANV